MTKEKEEREITSAAETEFESTLHLDDGASMQPIVTSLAYGIVPLKIKFQRYSTICECCLVFEKLYPGFSQIALQQVHACFTSADL